MTELTREKLGKILEEHKHWIDEDCKNWEEMRADLSEAYLRNADLRGAVLSDANLINADLRGADLSGADLCNADLSDTDLRGANLCNANLCNANLFNAVLSGADLRNANLCNANLCNANLFNANLFNAVLSNANLCNANLFNAVLSGANLCNANLFNAVLSGADLSGADLLNALLSEAHLSNTNLRDTKNVPYIPMVCPEEGDFIGWKKAEGNKDKVIVKLRIPSDAKRNSATTKKCRCSKAEVIAIYNLDGTEAEETTCHSDYDNSFIYAVGKTVEVTDFSEDRWDECAKGIHFFINRQEAINY